MLLRKKTFNILLLLLLVFAGCSFKTHTDVNIKNYLGVGSSVQQEKVVIEQIGQRPKNDQKNQEIYAVYISPGSYASASAIGAFKSFEKAFIKISLLSGHGLGAVIAALYAKSLKSNLVEWSWFKLIEKLNKNDRPYTNEWFAKIDEFIDEEFGESKFYDLKIPIVLTYYDRSRLKNINSGKLALHLKRSLRDFTNENRDDFNIVPSKVFKNLGADKFLILNCSSAGSKQNKIKNFDQLLSLINHVKIELVPDSLDDTKPQQSFNYINQGFSETKKWISATIDQ